LPSHPGRELAAARPDAFHHGLATSLNNQSIRLADLGRREEALAAIKEAVAIRQELAAARPDAFRLRLAGSLDGLAAGLMRWDVTAMQELRARKLREYVNIPGAPRKVSHN
jgi:hypothetical protein